MTGGYLSYGPRDVSYPSVYDIIHLFIVAMSTASTQLHLISAVRWDAPYDAAVYSRSTWPRGSSRTPTKRLYTTTLLVKPEYRATLLLSYTLFLKRFRFSFIIIANRYCCYRSFMTRVYLLFVDSVEKREAACSDKD